MTIGRAHRASRRRRRRAAELTLTVSGPILVLALWELLARTGRIDARFWPPPTSLIPTARRLITSGQLVEDLGASLFRILAGFVIASVPGVFVGLAMGLYRPVRLFLMPVAFAIYAVPKIAILPLMLIVFGPGESSKVAIVVISVFFLVVLSTMSGVLALDPIFRDVARDFDASEWQVIRTVALPGTLPAIFTGLRLALGFALVVIVGTEFLDAADGAGIGALIQRSSLNIAYEQMFVALIVVGLLGWLLTVLLDLVERLVVPWRS